MYANEEHHSNDSRNSYYSPSDNRKRAHDSSIDDEDVTPKRKVPTANGAFNMCNPHMYNAFQPNAQSTPQNLGYCQPSVPLMPTIPPGFFENYTYPNQWHNHTYPPYQPQLSTQHLANNSLPTSNYPMSSVPMQPTSFLAQNNTFESGIYTDSSSSSTLNTSSNTARDEVFMKVPGRLALLNNNSKLDITVSEVKRRTGAPENLNISLLGAFLRKAKNKGSNKQLNDELEEKGIEISKNRRVTLKQGAFTGLCEQEAMKLAEDFQGALSDHLATKTFTKEVKKSVVDKSSPLHTQFLQLIDNVTQYRIEDRLGDAYDDLKEFMFGSVVELLERDRSLLEMGYGDPANFVNRKPLPPDLQHQLYALNLVTHNFGVKAMHAVYAAELSDREPPSTSSAEHDDPDESY